MYGRAASAQCSHYLGKDQVDWPRIAEKNATRNTAAAGPSSPGHPPSDVSHCNRYGNLGRGTPGVWGADSLDFAWSWNPISAGTAAAVLVSIFECLRRQNANAPKAARTIEPPSRRPSPTPSCADLERPCVPLLDSGVPVLAAMWDVLSELCKIIRKRGAYWIISREYSFGILVAVIEV